MTYINARNSVGPAMAAAGAPEGDARLRQVVGQLQSVFVEQLFKAMRETVPTDGATSGGPGEAMFSGMFDQHLAGEVPSQWSHGIGESLYRQLQPQVARAAGAVVHDSTVPEVPR